MDKTNWKNFFENKTERCRVLVIGDVMIDKYYHGDVHKFASDAPVPVAKIFKRRSSLGAAANVAHNIALMGCQTYLAGFVGDDHNFETLSAQLTKSGINQTDLLRRKLLRRRKSELSADINKCFVWILRTIPLKTTNILRSWKII